MAFRPTNDLINALRAHLAALVLDPSLPEAEQEALFHRVGLFGAARMAEAMRAVFAAEQRVCFILPAGDAHEVAREGRHQLAKRTTRLALLIGDRVMDTAKEAALGGVLSLKDRVIYELCEAPAPGLCFEPAEGEPLVIEQADRSANNLGRECWLQYLTIPAGTARTAFSP